MIIGKTIVKKADQKFGLQECDFKYLGSKRLSEESEI